MWMHIEFIYHIQKREGPDSRLLWSGGSTLNESLVLPVHQPWLGIPQIDGVKSYEESINGYAVIKVHVHL